MKNKHKTITLEEMINREYPTPEARAEFDLEVKKAAEEFRKEAMKELADEIKAARKRAGVSQTELARRLNTNKSVISRVEAGDQNLTVEYIIKIAIALGRQYEVRIY